MIKKTFIEVISTLTEQYDIDLVDISEFFNTNGKSWLYNLIKSHHKHVFDDNYRLVLYFDKDEHLYSDSPGKLITELQRYIADIDISNFFVTVVTSDEKTEDDSVVVNKLYSTSSVPICIVTVNSVISKYNPLPKKKNTLCVHPWFQLHIGTGGDILPCCDSVHSIPIGNIKDNSISDIVDSENFKSIREKMLMGERPLECATCYDSEDSGIESKRNRVNKKYTNEYDAIVGGMETMNISRLDINLGSTCNFKCRMCTGFSSSRLRAEEKRINTHGDINYPILSQADIDNIMPELLDIVDDVDSIAFAGGESMLIPEYNQILERLIENGRTDVDIHYSSNISVLPKKAMRFWDDFKNLHITASVDSIDEHAEYYRHGTKWDNIVSNYQKLKDKGIELDIRSTLSIYNAFRLIQFQHEWISKSMIHPDAMGINIVEYPDYLSIQVLPISYRNRLISSIDAHIEFINGYNSTTLIHQWKRIQKFLTVDNSHKLDNFFKYTDKLDTHRIEKFELVHPEYINLRQHIGE